MRQKAFISRNIKELVRDPLSYVFIIGFPIIMLVIMTFVDQAIPPQAQMKIFHIPYLTPGMADFGLTFVMLFTCLMISKDRNSALLLRLYASPMKAFDFLIGYTIPVLAVAVAQAVIAFSCGAIIGVFTGDTLNILYIFSAIAALIPSAVLFISLGLFFGTVLSEKASPGVCSILITVTCILGGVWMDVEALSGVLKTASQILPFYHGVRAARMATAGDYGIDLWKSLGIISIYALVSYIAAVLVFRKKMKSDLK